MVRSTLTEVEFQLETELLVVPQLEEVMGWSPGLISVTLVLVTPEVSLHVSPVLLVR